MSLQHKVDRIFVDTDQHLEQVVLQLNELIALTEDKYAYIYQTLPSIEQEIVMSMREVEILLSYLVYTTETGDEGKGRSVTGDALTRIQQEFEEVTRAFLNQDLIDMLMRTFLNESGQDEQNFSEMSGLVKDVRDSLADLRDLALNSIIFSIRVGEEGAGFQILADRINQISSSLGAGFGQMDKAMEEMDIWNREFQKALIEFVEYEEDLKTRYQDNFNKEFSKIRKVLEVTCRLLGDHLKNAESVVRKVPEAMVLIQNQDIIRQNIENLIKCLNIAIQRQQGLKADDRDEVLNYIAFVKKVSELSVLLLDNVESGLDESIVVLEQVLEEINDQAQNLETETRYLGAFFAGACEDIQFDYNVMGNVFNTIVGQVEDLLHIREHLECKSQFLQKGRATFLGLMENINRDFEAINREIKTLKKMRVLIKIELARIEQGSNNSMQSIATAVDQVVDTVKNNQIVFFKLRDYFVRNINEFSSALEGITARLENSAAVLEVSKNKLLKAQSLVSSAIEAMVKEMCEIYTELKKPYAQIQVRTQVKDMVMQVRSLLQVNEESIIDKEKDLFNYFGVDKWNEREEDLQAILEQFTCFVERKSATSVFEDFDTGSDDHSSDIVLF